MFLGMLFFIVVAIGMVLEPQHLGRGSTYFCGVEGTFSSVFAPLKIGKKPSPRCEISITLLPHMKRITTSNATFQFVHGLNISISWGNRIWVDIEFNILGTLALQLHLKYLVRKKGLYQKSHCVKFGTLDWGCCYTTVSYFSAAALIFLSLYSYYVLGEEAIPFLFIYFL